STGSTHAWSIAFFLSSCSTHGGMRWTGSTTCALVMSQPRPSMNQPVPVSMNGEGFTVTGPLPQFIVISASTRAVTRATAGLAGRMACCADIARAGAAPIATVTTPTTTPTHRFIALTVSRRAAALHPDRTIAGVEATMTGHGLRPVEDRGESAGGARRRGGCQPAL